jgi:hypothetical protein
MNEYGQFVSADDRAEVQAWQFGQIIPLMLLLGPFMDVIRSLMVTFVEWRKKKHGHGDRPENSTSPEGHGEVEKISSGDTDVESIMPKLVMPVIKEVHGDDAEITEEIKEVGSKGEVKEVEEKENVKEEVIEEKESLEEEIVEEKPKEEGEM